MTDPRYRHAEPVRVRWVEVDMQRIVFNGHYLMYVDTALAGYWRALALPYQAAMKRLDGDLFVRKSVLEYLQAAEYDDVLQVGVRCERVGTSSIAFTAAVQRDGATLVTCDMVYVFADAIARRPRPVPDVLRQTLHAFEAGDPMLEVEIGAWQALGAEAKPLREDVFLREQRIDAPLGEDPADACDAAVHAVARNRLGMAVATGRLVPVAEGVAQFGRLAVDRGLRGAGIGGRVLRALLEEAAHRGVREVVLQAPVRLTSFYARAGFTPRGAPFEAAGLAHQEMALQLVPRA